MKTDSVETVSLTPIQILALSKALTKKDIDAARAQLGPGKHQVDMTINLSGTVSIGNSGEKKSTVSIPVKGVLGILLQRAGVTREASIALITDAVTQAMKASEEGTKGESAMDSYVDELFEEVTCNLCSALPKTPTSGRITTSLICKIIE